MVSGGGRGRRRGDHAEAARRRLDPVARPARSRAGRGLRRARRPPAAFPFDATDPATAAPWVAATVERFGRLDALVNNAGILRMVDFAQGSEDDLDEMWAVNVKAPFRLIREALPHLRASRHGPRRQHRLDRCQALPCGRLHRLRDDQARASGDDPGRPLRRLGRRRARHRPLPGRDRHRPDREPARRHAQGRAPDARDRGGDRGLPPVAARTRPACPNSSQTPGWRA